MASSHTSRAAAASIRWFARSIAQRVEASYVARGRARFVAGGASAVGTAWSARTTLASANANSTGFSNRWRAAPLPLSICGLPTGTGNRLRAHRRQSDRAGQSEDVVRAEAATSLQARAVPPPNECGVDGPRDPRPDARWRCRYPTAQPGPMAGRRDAASASRGVGGQACRRPRPRHRAYAPARPPVSRRAGMEAKGLRRPSVYLDPAAALPAEVSPITGYGTVAW